MRIAAAAALLALGACSFDAVDLDGKRCPCAAGWECDPDTATCLPVAPRDGGTGETRDSGPGGLDASADGGQLDGGQLDGGPVEGGPIDAPTGEDAGPDSTACDDRYAGALLCDGYEDVPAFSVWTENRGAEVVRAPVYRGSMAMRSISTSGDAINTLYEQIPPTTSGELHLRSYLFYGSGMRASSVVVLHFEEGGAPFDYAEIRLADDALVLASRYLDMGSTASPVALPRDRWVCVELVVRIAASGGSIQMLVDDAPAAEITDVTTRLTAAWRTAYVGISHRGSTQLTNVTVVMDETVIDTSHIGCD